jgi:hypothetical protein
VDKGIQEDPMGAPKGMMEEPRVMREAEEERRVAEAKGMMEEPRVMREAEEERRVVEAKGVPKVPKGMMEEPRVMEVVNAGAHPNAKGEHEAPAREGRRGGQHHHTHRNDDQPVTAYHGRVPLLMASRAWRRAPTGCVSLFPSSYVTKGRFSSYRRGEASTSLQQRAELELRAEQGLGE